MGLKMEAVSWKLDELHQLTKTLSLPDVGCYTSSFDWKWQLAQYHSYTCHNLVNEFHSKPMVVFGDQDTKLVFLSYEANFVACMQCAHSSLDIFAQIIGAVLFPGEFDEGQVSFSTILSRLKK